MRRVAQVVVAGADGNRWVGMRVVCVPTGGIDVDTDSLATFEPTVLYTESAERWHHGSGYFQPELTVLGWLYYTIVLLYYTVLIDFPNSPWPRVLSRPWQGAQR